MPAFFFATDAPFASAAEHRVCGACSATDPFDPGDAAIMPAGPYKGQCQDSCRRRSAKLLSRDEAAVYAQGDIREGEIFVANVGHEKAFHVARIPIHGVRDVIMQVERFPPEVIAAHVQLRFHFAEWVELVPQDLALADRTSIWMKDLVFSVEYSAPPEVPFDLIKGLTDFALVERMVSLSNRFHSMILEQQHRVQQFRLALTEREKEGALIYAVAMASVYGMERMYNTVTRSCVTEAFKVVDATTDYVGRHKTRNPFAMTRIPVLTEQAIKLRGLWDKNSRMPDLNNEQVPPVIRSKTRPEANQLN